MQPACGLQSSFNLLLSKPFISRLCVAYAPLFIRSIHTSKPDTSASDRLFADAAKEEQAETAEVKRASKLPQLENQHENWTGDESVKDAVLRMLMDKYKPLRTGTIHSAEDKLKRSPPKVAHVVFPSVPSPDANILPNLSRTTLLKPSTGSWASEPLLPSNPNHEPWHTEFKVPSHETSSVKLAQMPPAMLSSPASSKWPTTIKSDKLTKEDRQAKRRKQQAGRLTEARELTLDYRMGLKKPSSMYKRPNPVNMKGWTSLIEDRIETARKTGYFVNVKGRGQPLARTAEESNPFISREEYLMNRIVQRNGASPPWVEVQGELDAAVATFREILKQSYTRRVIRALASNLSTGRLNSLTLDDIKAHKDHEWIGLEKGYHEAAIEELNKLVRKYNGMAPYAARRGYYLREVEIGKLGEECARDVMVGLKERLNKISLERDGGQAGSPTGPQLQDEIGVMKHSFFAWLRALWRRMFGAG